jgi:predicted ester cyclase
MGRRNLDSMKSADLAWNERRWNEYADLFDEDATVCVSGGTHGKDWHVVRARTFCEAFPDAHVNMTPYLDLFISHDGSKTCSVAELTGTMKGTVTYGPLVIQPNQKRFSITFMAISRWRNGKVFEHREFFDRALLARQLEIPAF